MISNTKSKRVIFSCARAAHNSKLSPNPKIRIMTNLDQFRDKAARELQLGDLVEVTWLDASMRRLETVEELRESGAAGAEIDLPVSSGYFILWMDNNTSGCWFSSWLILQKLNAVSLLENKLYRPQNIVSVRFRFHFLH